MMRRPNAMPALGADAVGLVGGLIVRVLVPAALVVAFGGIVAALLAVPSQQTIP